MSLRYIERIPYTCQYIDGVIDLVEVYMDDETAKADAKNFLEEIRSLNSQLREFGQETVDLLEKAEADIENLETEIRAAKNDYEGAEDEIASLKREITRLEDDVLYARMEC